jgi:hypothetical protein
VDVLLLQLMQFTDSVIQNKKNGYKGYKIELFQEDGSISSTEASSENPDFKRYQIRLKVSIEHLDISAIEMQETAEVHQDYTKSLGLFACFLNEKANLSQVFRLDVN